MPHSILVVMALMVVVVSFDAEKNPGPGVDLHLHFTRICLHIDRIHEAPVLILELYAGNFALNIAQGSGPRLGLGDLRELLPFRCGLPPP